MSVIPHHRFETTRWSVVRAAAGDHSVAQRALAELCEIYWYPLYAYVRRQGHDADEARDLTQSFIVLLIERGDMRRLQRSRGRFRSFLLTSVRHFLINQALSRRTQKRGGGQILLSLEFETAETRYALEPAETSTPETLFEHRWALTVLDRVFRQIREEWQAAGKGTEFELLKECLAEGVPRGGYESIASKLGSSENAARISTHRLRRRFQRQLREVIADTVQSQDAIDDEIRYLFRALQR
jgi:RNA polymerase sigma-70 factor (ECF subfamily)